MSSPSPSPPAQPDLRFDFAEAYEQALVGPLFRPWVESLLEAVELEPRHRVLDVACGTGIVARIARERLGSAGAVVGVDSNPLMLAVARRIAPTIDWREGSADALPLRDGERFDVVVCQQGFQFFADRDAAARQAHGALATGGRFAASTWRPDDECPVLHALRGIAERHVGPIADRRHGLGDPGPLEAVLRAAGFEDVRSTRASRTIRFRDGYEFVRLNAMALVGMSARSGTLDEEGRQRANDLIVADSAAVVQANSDEAGFAFELGTNVTLARA